MTTSFVAILMLLLTPGIRRDKSTKHIEPYRCTGNKCRKLDIECSHLEEGHGCDVLRTVVQVLQAIKALMGPDC